MRGGLISRDKSKRAGHIQPKKAVFLMVEGESEKVYFDRIARLPSNYSITAQVSEDKKCTDIIENCAKITDRKGLDDDDLKIAVFDLDVVDEQLLNEAVALADKEGVIIMASNLSFELWLLLHFEDPSHVYTQDDYEERLTGLLGRKYAKAKGLGDKVNPESIKNAVKRGKAILPDENPLKCKDTPNSSMLWKLIKTIMENESTGK